MTIAQDDYKALIKKHRPKGGSGTGMGWVKKLSEALQKKIRASKTAADASVDTTISAGQRAANAIRAATPDLYRGESTPKSDVKERRKDKVLDAKLKDAVESKKLKAELKETIAKSRQDEPLKKQEVPAREAIINVELAENRTNIVDSKNVPKKEIKKVQAKIDNSEETDGPYGTKAGRKAIQGFFSDTFGIKDIEVDYSYPREGESQDKKKGGKVTAKKKKKASYGKKYSMNRGGMASLRKPTRV